MTNLKKRLVQLEVAQEKIALKQMTDDELMAYAGTLENGSFRWWEAIITKVLRRPSALQIVHDDPELGHGKQNYEDSDWDD